MNRNLEDYPMKPGEEKPFRVLRQWFPQEGGIFTQVAGFKYPYRGHPEEHIVDILSVIKGMVPMVITFLSQAFRIPTPRRIKALKECMETLLSVCHRAINTKIPVNAYRYCEVAREVHRVSQFVLADIWIDGLSRKDMRKRHHKRFALHRTVAQLTGMAYMILEFDNAYRYRFQDISQEINKANFANNPAKETARLFDILIERDNSQSMKAQWRQAKKVLVWIFRLSRLSRNLARQFVQELDINQCKMQEDDEYWCGIRIDYNFKGEDYTYKKVEK